MLELIDLPKADTDFGIGVLDGKPVAFVLDADDDLIGYYNVVADGEYVHCPYIGTRWYVDGGFWSGVHDTYPVREGFSEAQVSDGSQQPIYRDDEDWMTILSRGVA